MLCVGNMTVGGSGKTPTALALAHILTELGHRPAFLTRGHGGRRPGPLRVDPDRDACPDVGDEALLLARQGLTIVARDRPAGAALAASLGADAVVMDDGLQNPALAKDLVLAVFDAGVGIGNGRVLPAGPLRARPEAQWPLLDAIVTIGRGAPGDILAREGDARGLPVLRAGLVPDPEAGARLAGRRVLAFAGIGRPEKFFATLRSLGADLVESRPFADHHAYRPAEMADLSARARAARLLLVTTEKDAVRLPAPFRSEVATLPVALRFEALDAVRGLLQAAGFGRGLPSRVNTASGDT